MLAVNAVHHYGIHDDLLALLLVAIRTPNCRRAYQAFF
jgi:hypothetical protein